MQVVPAVERCSQRQRECPDSAYLRCPLVQEKANPMRDSIVLGPIHRPRPVDRCVKSSVVGNIAESVPDFCGVPGLILHLFMVQTSKRGA